MSENITLNGIEYAPVKPPESSSFVIVRSRDSGVTAGYLARRDGREVTLADAFRIWKWSGAFTLFEMANHGVTNPSECKFSERVDQIDILDACEVIPCSDKSKESLQSVDPCKV